MQPSRNYVKQGYVLTRSGHVLSRPCTPNEKKCEKVTRSVTFRATVPRIRSSKKETDTIDTFSLQRLKTQIHIHISRQLNNRLKYEAVKSQGSQLNNRLDPTDGYENLFKCAVHVQQGYFQSFGWFRGIILCPEMCKMIIQTD